MKIEIKFENSSSYPSLELVNLTTRDGIDLITLKIIDAAEKTFYIVLQNGEYKGRIYSHIDPNFKENPFVEEVLISNHK